MGEIAERWVQKLGLARIVFQSSVRTSSLLAPFTYSISPCRATYLVNALWHCYSRA
jgi:hypothetical protein